MTYVPVGIETAIRELMDKYTISKAEATRQILENGVVYMAMFGDGIQDDSK